MANSELENTKSWFIERAQIYRMQMTDLKVDSSEIPNGIVRYRYKILDILGLMSYRFQDWLRN